MKVKPVILNKVGKDGTTNIKIRLTHQGKSREFATPYYIQPGYIKRDGTIKNTYPNATRLNKALHGLLSEYEGLILDIGSNIGKMDINTIVARLRNKENGKDFIKYAEQRRKELEEQERFSYAITYKVMLLHLKKFISKESLNFKEITPEFLTKFELYLKLKGDKVNTIRIYLNNIRAIFNHALDNDVIQLPSPYRKFKVKHEKSEQRSLDVNSLRKLMYAPYFPAQQRAVDIFFLSLYLIGINLKDLLYLTSDRLYDGRLHYRRAKTNGLYSVKLSPEALSIIEKYRGKKYLLNVLEENDSFMHYKCVLKETNKRLRLAGITNGIPYLSTYTARHSFATLAYNNCGYSVDQIGQALGHIDTNHEVTNVYINKKTEIIDEMQENVLKLLK